jgi:hypothetical protein
MALWPILTSLAVGAGATWGWLEGALDTRIQAAVQAHDRELYQAAHPAIQTRLEAVERWSEGHLKDHATLRTRVGVTEAQLYELYWFYVGDKALEIEPDRRRRAAAANAARERFRRYVKDGEDLVNAFRHALEGRPPR